MKQIIHDFSSGVTELLDVPRPGASRGTLVVDGRLSLISVGTERMLVEFGQASLVQKARQQPEKVRQVLDKVRKDGLVATIDAVRSKLSAPVPLGYSHVGVVGDVGAGVTGFAPGDRVVSNGAHAEVIRAPVNLCARIPDEVSDDAAAFTVVAGIGLQGIRLAAPTLGESVVVMGAGLIGLLTAQLLLANGCRVLVTDFDAAKLALARKWGAETCQLGEGVDPVEHGIAFSGGRGVDAVLITASTKSNDPVRQAARMSRKRGRIVLVGVTGLELDRADFYEKELSFQVSCSYGPGRYDPAYEEGGQDYPLGFVRWTEQRNFEAVLAMMASGRIDVSDMVSARVPFGDAPAAYDRLVEDRSLLGVLLTYAPPADARSRSAHFATGMAAPATGAFGVVGAGNYAARILMPALKAAGAVLGPVVTSAGLSGSIAARKFGFESSTTDLDAVLADDAVVALVIATRHDSHASLVARALDHGKHVFVEKPLAIDRAGIEAVRAAYAARAAAGAAPCLTVGFNRRWAPMVVKMKALLDRREGPASFVMTVNAGAIPADHWTQDAEAGGGRIIGEACHFIDLMRHLAGSAIVAVTARGMGANRWEAVREDKAMILLEFADGSHGAVNYLANGGGSFPKERIEVFAGGATLQLDNYRALRGFGWPGFRSERALNPDKGQTACVAAFHRAVVEGLAAPIAPEELFEVAEFTLQATEQLRA